MIPIIIGSYGNSAYTFDPVAKTITITGISEDLKTENLDVIFNQTTGEIIMTNVLPDYTATISSYVITLNSNLDTSAMSSDDNLQIRFTIPDPTVDNNNGSKIVSTDNPDYANRANPPLINVTNQAVATYYQVFYSNNNDKFTRDMLSTNYNVKVYATNDPSMSDTDPTGWHEITTATDFLSSSPATGNQNGYYGKKYHKYLIEYEATNATNDLTLFLTQRY